MSPLLSDTSFRSFFYALYLLILLPVVGQAQIYNDIAIDIYEEITSLKLSSAKENLTKNSGNIHGLAKAHLGSYIDFFTLFINEDKAVYKSIKSNKDRYLASISKYSNDNPYARFVEAEILLQWALIELKFDEKYSAYTSIYNAYNLLEENKKKYPDFIDNLKSLSIIHVLAESIPTWARKMLGIKGSISLGTNEIKKLKLHALSTPNYMFRKEVAAINSYILFYQSNKQKQAISDLEAFKLDHKQSPLIAFLKASMALRAGHNDKCLTYLLESPNGSEYSQFHYLNFMIGRSKLYKMQKDADVYLKKYIQTFKGQHFIKEAYQKLAWHALVILEDKKLYDQYMQSCKKYGEALLDEDKQALKEASRSSRPDQILLKARLYCDGGYFSTAYQHLLVSQSKISHSIEHQIEYQYRMGRILQDLTRSAESILYYMKTIEIGRSHPSYYACSAALQLGKIYEGNRNLILAKKYYTECLNITPDEYATSLHQKAKSGLERMK